MSWRWIASPKAANRKKHARKIADNPGRPGAAADPVSARPGHVCARLSKGHAHPLDDALLRRFERAAPVCLASDDCGVLRRPRPDVRAAQPDRGLRRRLHNGRGGLPAAPALWVPDELAWSVALWNRRLRIPHACGRNGFGRNVGRRRRVLAGRPAGDPCAFPRTCDYPGAGFRAAVLGPPLLSRDRRSGAAFSAVYNRVRGGGRREMEVRDDALAAEVERILESDTFRNSDALRRLLRFLADKRLAGEADQLKEYSVGIDALGKPATYDPRHDSTVRIQVSRLRQKLAEYYRTEGKNDAMLVDLPKGRFKLTCEENVMVAARPAVEERASAAVTLSQTRTRLNRRVLLLSTGLLVAVIWALIATAQAW